jgi:hypothetical protein
MAIEDTYADVLQNIESAIVKIYRQQPGLLDYDVEGGLNGLIVEYKAEHLNRPAPSLRLAERETLIYQAVKDVCEWRLGREEFITAKGGDFLPPPAPKTVEEIIACLQRIRKSVQKWNRQGGRQGYLYFIVQYVA